jgi:hypothetical protein
VRATAPTFTVACNFVALDDGIAAMIVCVPLFSTTRAPVWKPDPLIVSVW